MGIHRLCIALVCSLAIWVGVGPVHAQEPDSLETTYRVETREGTTVVGTLVSETEAEVVLKTKELGTVTIKRADIKRMEEVGADRFQEGEYWFRNPQSTRYLFAPNALGLPKGAGYYQNTWILFNNVNYGVSDHFSMGGGTVPVFLFGAAALPIWFLPKVSVSTPRDNLHLAGGAVIGGVVGAGGDIGLGLVYGSATVGGRDRNATIGLGYGYTDGEFSDTPAINVSGMTRVSRTVYLLTENYFFPAVEDANLVSVGVRWAPENFAVDFALFRPLGPDIDGFVALPWLGVTIPF